MRFDSITQAGDQLLALQAQQLTDLPALLAANGRAQPFAVDVLPSCDGLHDLPAPEKHADTTIGQRGRVLRGGKPRVRRMAGGVSRQPAKG